MSSTNTINQKEYLKKYLGVGKAPGDRKKKKKTVVNRLKVIDDDIDNYNISKEIQADIEAADEDAPQIVSVIDERPPSLRVDEKTNVLLWKPLGENNDLKEGVSIKMNSFQLKKPKLESKSNLFNQKNNSAKDHHLRKSSVREELRDISPPRRAIKREKSDNDNSLPRRSEECIKDNSPLKGIKQECSDNDMSPPRKKNTNNHDLSPFRKNKSYTYEKNISLLRSIDDNSHKNSRSFKGQASDEDISPQRKTHNDSSLKWNVDREYRRKYSESSRVDISPSRRADRDISPPRKNKIHYATKEDDYSQRKTKSSSRRNLSKDTSPPRKPKREQSNSPHEKIKNNQKHSRWGDWSPDHSDASTSRKPDKTMSGKKAGLQSAKELIKELNALRTKEDKVFQKMSEEVSGRNAATVVRGQKPVDPEEEARKLQKEKEVKDKYDRWGKGLKQVENEHQRMENQLYEMSKPLARYADDEDLEKYLKEQEREGDPMLEYLRKKKKKKKVEAAISEKPVYMGEFNPNRFGIKPGYRWDGVDRSNGYEAKWYEKFNAKKAIQEEALKWSTEDM